MLQSVYTRKTVNRHFSLDFSKFCDKNNLPQCLVVFSIVIHNAFQFSEHVSMFQTSSSAIMNI